MLTFFSDAPKQIYHCDFEGCERHFVRQDLCARHRERHSKENSHLYRRDAFKNGKSSSKLSSASINPQEGPSAENHSPSSTTGTNDSDPQNKEQTSTSKPQDSILGFGSMALDPRLTSEPANFQPPLQSGAFSGAIDGRQYNNGLAAASASITSQLVPPSLPEVAQTTSTSTDTSGIIDNRANGGNVEGHHVDFARPSIPQTHQMDMYHLNSMQNMFTPLNNASITYLPQPYPSPTTAANLKFAPSLTSLPPFGLPYGNHIAQLSDMRSDSVTSYFSKNTLADAHGTHHYQPAAFSEPPMFDPLQVGATMPVFNENYGPSPLEIQGPEFISWLFEGDQNAVFTPLTQAPYNDQITTSQMLHPVSQPSHEKIHMESLVNPAPVSKTELDSAQPESALSNERRRQLLELIVADFEDARHIQVTSQREKTLKGDHDEDSHVLSLRMMQVHLGSFWLHIHPQLPILHKPTFSAETCPDLLLIAIMTLGASCIDASYGYEVAQAAADLASFLAWHTRHMIFEDPDCLPPAKLWVFQALLLLEIFEKMFSTTTLHQRAHVHHATTLTLMRRGSSLIGRSALDFPPYDRDPTRTPPGPNGSVNTAGRNTKDEWWNNWISNEATRRTAFAAFIIDITHSTMFGHSAVMVAHDLRIPLPCDEALWAAPSGAEVRRHEQRLVLNGHRPMRFLDALKMTLKTQSVQTNTFGRVIIMAGLLSINWHMKMQDMRANSIGVGKAGSWSDQLASACDFWRRDFDASLADSTNIYLPNRNLGDVVDKDKVFESRTVLHHLARMAMHVDIVDCQILAGAKRSLGRVITANDHAVASKKMKEVWAPSHEARDAVFHALRFLSAVLVPDDDGSAGLQPSSLGLAYSARDDNLLNRPWVLYIAALVVWTYGWCLDGRITPAYTLSTHEMKFRDLRGFLRCVGGVKSADDLQHVKHRNGCLGLLMLLREIFSKTRWELLHEASEMLGNCIELLMPGGTNNT